MSISEIVSLDYAIPIRKRFLIYLLQQDEDYSFHIFDAAEALHISEDEASELIDDAISNKIIERQSFSYSKRKGRNIGNINSPYVYAFLTKTTFIPTNSKRNRGKQYVVGRKKSTRKKDPRISSGKYQFEESKKYESIAGVMNSKREVDKNKYKYTNKSALNLKKDLRVAKEFREFYGTDY